jgi:hypothetical protein
MSELKYKRIPTTVEVCFAIVREHTKGEYPQDLCVYETFTNIVENGISTIYTVWGLREAEVALVGAHTTYESEDDKEIENTRKSEYWLCAPYLEEDE